IGQALAYFDARQYSYEIVVAADGDDGTREIVAELAKTDPSLRVLGSVERRGKGHGIRQAVAIARGQIIGFADADNKTPIEELDRVLPLLREGADVVIGSRRIDGARIERRQPLYRRTGSRAFAAFMHLIVGLPDLVDTQCGFKFFRGPVAIDLFARSRIDGYMFDVEILFLARRAGYSIAQVPVRWRDDGDSRLQLFSGNLRNGRDLLMIRLWHRRASSARPTSGTERELRVDE
ncbi:MAG: dolichyl-phosphate beta-glucosyltransferase, partial [Chloroflexota bacterium]